MSGQILLDRAPPEAPDPRPEASVTERLVPLLRRPVDEATRARAALHVLDWIGCATAGSVSEAGRAFLRFAGQASPGPGRVVGGGSVPAREAAFANGAFGNVLEMDDVHRAAILHPGPVVIPAALAAAQARRAGGPAFLDAVVRGYEAMIRLGRAVGPAHYRHFHNTSTCGPFGAAAAVGDLIGLDDAAFADALGNAGTQAAGFWQCRHEPVMTKQLHTARAAQAGYDAALLAGEGVTGPRLILEGPQGFFAATAPDGDPARVLGGEDGPWLVFATSFKPWPACRHCHPAIDAALALRPRLAGRAVRNVEIGAYRDAVVFCDRRRPETGLEAKFSLQHAVAIALLDGQPGLDAFEPSRFARRSDLANLRDRARVIEDPSLTARYPAHFGARLAVVAADGERLEAEVADALGDPENPLGEEALVDKARLLMGSAGIDPAPVEAAVAAALALPGAGDLSALARHLP